MAKSSTPLVEYHPITVVNTTNWYWRLLKFIGINFSKLGLKLRGKAFGISVLTVFLSFEYFNYSLTHYALVNILGGSQVYLALIFCVMDFAGIWRIFTPETGRDEPAVVWYLFGAWFLAAAFNSSLTWWGVAIYVLQHSSSSIFLLAPETMTKIVPIGVAAFVLLFRVLLINTISIAGDLLFHH